MDSFARNTLALCRAHALDCRTMAARAATAEERELLLEVAGHWDALADILERHRPPDDGG